MADVLPNVEVKLWKIPKENRFGAIRKYDIHTGLDIFCLPYSVVNAFEDGKVVGVVPFTGEKAGSPWWKDTSAVLVEGASGVILYGEIEPHPRLENWNENSHIEVKAGEPVGTVLQVLKRDKGKPMSMLHIELYEHGYKGTGEIWSIHGSQPAKLLNVETLFKKDFIKKLYGYLRNERFTFFAQKYSRIRESTLQFFKRNE